MRVCVVADDCGRIRRTLTPGAGEVFIRETDTGDCCTGVATRYWLPETKSITVYLSIQIKECYKFTALI